MTGPQTKEGAEELAVMTHALLAALPEGLTATVILCAGTAEEFQVSVAGSTPKPLLRLVLQRALERMEAH